jgi:hypothetical protein
VARARSKANYDAAHEATEFEVGDEVYVYFGHLANKWEQRWFGGFRIDKWHDPEARRTVHLTHKDNPRDTMVVHVDRLKKAVEPAMAVPDEEWRPWTNLVQPEQPEEGEARVAEESQDHAEQPAEDREGPDREPEREGPPEAADQEGLPDIDPNAESDMEYEVKQILEHREDATGVRRYKIRWAGFSPAHDSWLDEEALSEAPLVVAKYQEELNKAVKKPRRGRREGGGADDQM